MPAPTEEMWKDTASRSYELWDLPHCIGNIDGKHIRIKKIPHSGSEYFNYKGFFSIVLMACTDADGIFSCIDVGHPGRYSDGAIFKVWALGNLMQRNELSIPQPIPLPKEQVDFPFFFAADEAFPLCKHIMRPYPQKVLDNERRIFNGRLSRSRQIVECSFGMFTSKFEILQRAMRCNVETAIAITKAVCILHNFIRIREGKVLPTRIPKEDASTYIYREPSGNTLRYQSPRALREHLTYYLVHKNPVPWQKDFCVPL